MKPTELAAGLMDMHYDREVESTPEGRRSLELRGRGHVLDGMGRADEALAMFQQAVALFPEAENGAAAAAARHDLAHALSERREIRYLLMAEKLYRRALESAARARVPRRYAETENSLAVCLRRRAGLETEDQRRATLDEVEALYRRAIRRLEGTGLIGLEALAQGHLNLGNFLCEEKEELDRGLREYDRALGISWKAMAPSRKSKERPSHSIRKVRALAHLTPAGHLRIRGRKKDLARAERLARAVIEEGDPDFADMARLELAEVLLAGEATDRKERVQKLLLRVQLERVEGKYQIHLADLLRRADAPQGALELLQKLIHEGIRHRARTISDFVADQASSEFQEAAGLAARILALDLARPVDAFLELENASALRFSEALSWQTWVPKDAACRELHRRLSSQMGRTWQLDGFMQMLAPLDPRAQTEALGDLLSHLPAPPEQDDDFDHVVSMLDGARAEPVPVQYLQRVVTEGSATVTRLRVALAKRDEGFVEREEVLGELDAEGLLAALRETPSQALIRLKLDQELFIVAVWLDGDRVAGRSLSLPLELRLLELLFEAGRDPQKADFEQLTRLLAGVDISAVFPGGPWERAVMLPSYHAAGLPLAALGPRGARPVDRFRSIVWLPCVYPLRIRQAPHPPRTARLLIVPETTKFHDLALEGSLEGERRLTGQEATVDAVERALREADTVSIYAHGRHQWGEPPKIGLSDGQLEFAPLGHDLLGLERLENWACESGTNRPADPLTPLVDEGFGLDFQLLMNGARSAIGTLWKVPDLVTAFIVRRYRSLLNGGMEASRALAESQRWWDAEGVPALLALRREMPLHEAAKAFAASLGGEVDPEALQAPLGDLAPVSDHATDLAIKWLRDRIACPISWAGLRFVGLSERRPTKPWVAPNERPLSEEDLREIDALVAQEVPKPNAYDDLQEERLAELVGPEVQSPEPDRAIQIARLMRERHASSYRDNLLQGLAWLHEALAAPALAEGERARLAVEAAHLWLDLAEGEYAPSLPFVLNGVAMSRARALLDAAPASTDARVARARLRVFDHLDEDGLEGLPEVVRGGVEELDALLGQFEPGSFEAMRAVTVALELRPLGGGKPGPAGERVLQAARQMVKATPVVLEKAFGVHRLLAALDVVEPQEDLAERATYFLTARELVPVVIRELQRQGPPVQGSRASLQVYDRALSRMEGDMWGYAAEDRSPLLRTVGTPGLAYRELLASYLLGHASFHQDEAAHKIACLQYGCDLRVPFLHRLVHLQAQFGDEAPLFVTLWRLLRRRLAIHAALADAAFLGDIGAGKPDHPHPCDPYTLPPSSLGAGEDATCLTAWSLWKLCSDVNEAPRARTAAFKAVVLSAGLERDLVNLWSGWRTVEQTMTKEGSSPEWESLARFLWPELMLPENEKRIRSLPEGRAVLGLASRPLGELIAMAFWAGTQAKGEHSLRLERTGLGGLLERLFQLAPSDYGPRCGDSAPRRETWASVEEILAPVLSALVVPSVSRPALAWSVLAPGALRPLPLLGMRVRGRLLAEQVKSVAHLPALGFGALPEGRDPDFTLCLLAREHEAGSTVFGEAAIGTLRQIHPPDVVADVRERPKGTVVEVDVLERYRESIRTLRLYGVGRSITLNDTLAALALEDGQALSERNISETFLPRGAVVELWAATAGMADAERVAHRAGDRIPGLAWGFLANGALAVIDVAWPVHDVVKALVCERYGMLRRVKGHGAAVLAAAIAEVAEMLELLRGLPASCHAGEVLALLDKLRQTAAQKLKFSASLVMPFEAALEKSGLEAMTGAELRDELAQPVHLAAFRWWGG